MAIDIEIMSGRDTKKTNQKHKKCFWENKGASDSIFIIRAADSREYMSENVT